MGMAEMLAYSGPVSVDYQPLAEEPVSWEDMPITRPVSAVALLPEGRLVEAVLLQAISDLGRVGRPSGLRPAVAASVAEDARRWVREMSYEPFGFAWCCDLLGLNPSAAARRILSGTAGAIMPLSGCGHARSAALDGAARLARELVGLGVRAVRVGPHNSGTVKLPGGEVASVLVATSRYRPDGTLSWAAPKGRGRDAMVFVVIGWDALYLARRSDSMAGSSTMAGRPFARVRSWRDAAVALAREAEGWKTNGKR